MTVNRQINCPDPHDPDGSARLNVCLHGDKISLSSDGQCSFHFFMTFASARALAAAIVEAVPAPEVVS